MIPTIFAGWRLYVLGEVHWLLCPVFAVGLMVMCAHLYFPDPISHLLVLPLAMINTHYFLLGVGTILLLLAGLVSAVFQRAAGRPSEMRPGPEPLDSR